MNLLGINSVEVANAERRRIWQRLAETLPVEKLEAMTAEIDLSQVVFNAPLVLEGDIQGRIVVVI